VLPDGEAAVDRLSKIGPTLEFIKDTYRHCKVILALGVGKRLLKSAGIPDSLPDGGADPGLLNAADAKQATKPLIAAVSKHRHFERQTDPPRV
jgi:catalase